MPVFFPTWALLSGKGVGVEIGANDLLVTIADVRPGKVEAVASHRVADFRQRPAVEWGREFAAFLSKHRAGHVAAVVLLPRRDVIVRTLAMPGVPAEELDSAVTYQVDGLHPFAEEDAVAAWAPLAAPNVLIGVAQRQLFAAMQGLFAEAGVKVASFTFSAAAFYTALRVHQAQPGELITAVATDGGIELYGESEAKPAYSALIEADELAAAIPRALAELRLPADSTAKELGLTAPLAAAVMSAMPRRALAANFLPEGQRKTNSKWRYVPTVILTTTLAALLAALYLHEPYDTRQYVQALLDEQKRLQPEAMQVPRLEEAAQKARQRVQQMDDFRRRTKQDLDLVLELTNSLQPPTFVSGLDITRDTVTLVGETDSAAPLLRALDNSPRLDASEFTMPIGRVNNGELFRIRSRRQFLPDAAKPEPSKAEPNRQSVVRVPELLR